MAGSGSRLRTSGEVLPKPLISILGRPLICYVLEALEKIGVRNLHIVVGLHGGALAEAMRALVPSAMRLNTIVNPESQKQNGLSVLCAAGHVRGPFFLTMGDHLFDPAVLDRLFQQGDRDKLNLAIDRKLDAIFDLDDAMKVQTRGGRVLAIGKQLATYDAIDTGVFLSPNELFDFLERAKQDGDCSLADGVRLMAEQGKVCAVDIGQGWWQDVDTVAMRRRAEEVLSKRLSATL